MGGDKISLAFQLVFLGKHVGHLIERRLANRGLNRTQMLILTALSRHPGLKALDLCGPARVEPANVTRTLQSLERLGLLERHPHPTDGRASLFYLTPAGQLLSHELSEEMERLSAELVQGIGPQELEDIEKSLGGLVRNLHRRLSGFGPSPCGDHPSPSDLSEAEFGTLPRGDSLEGNTFGSESTVSHASTDR